ncbi:hypothetical protein B0I35DRAFT_411268 [Stachybotrys elegans]|uniref:NADH:flavin oxidoreductase/NADH oxidase N-terminal domain-containing protein n=1 Tax=Stachybotrys elegans TaxID=80388 RepID=A0A8K0SK75_9HYPO|nr:hypothetical protein B0I35DRAFT_411268 [Stachybotrys elegans]
MTRLFEPLSVGSTALGHRVAMAPLTRCRCDDWAPTAMVQEYYEQRACVPGTLLITEATLISERSISIPSIPGIWADAHVAAWRRVTDAVHAKGCRIFCQLWHHGRAGSVDVLEAHGLPLLSSSAVPMTPGSSSPTPREMTEAEIAQVIEDFAAAARNAIAAGFDGVEIHGANGYLLDQFLQDTCNRRTDRWGGSVENRARLHVEVAKAVAAAVGADRTAMRLSPYSDFQGMLMDEPEPTFAHVLEQLRPLGLAYLHLVEARIRGTEDAECGGQRSVRWMVEQWANASPVLLAGGFTADSARQAVNETYRDYDVVVVFGRYFVSNPDLVYRVKEGVELLKYDRATFYVPLSPTGYIDYAFSKEFVSSAPQSVEA